MSNVPPPITLNWKEKCVVLVLIGLTTYCAYEYHKKTLAQQVLPVAVRPAPSPPSDAE